MLPPRVVERNYTDTQFKSLPKIRAERLEIVDRNPVLHGGLTFDSKTQRIRILSADGTKIYGVSSSVFWMPTTSLSRADVTPVAGDLADNFIWRLKESWPKGILNHALGPFFLEGTRTHFNPQRADNPVWSLDLGFVPDRGEVVTSSRGWVAWRVEPGEYFFMPPRAVRAYRTKTPPEGELVRMFGCEGGGGVSVENLERGFVRFVFWTTDFEPSQMGLFDLGGEQNRGDLAQVVQLGDCRRFVLQGAFGLARLQLSARSQ